MPTDQMPPNTVMLSEVMRELSARPGFTEAFLKEVEGGSKKSGAALLTPALVDHLRKLILGKDWQSFDHFPGWTMAEINPTVRVVGHLASKDDEVKKSATAGGASRDSAAQTFLDLGRYTLDQSAAIDLQTPVQRPAFDADGLISDLGDGVTRGDGPSPLAAEHAESHRLADALNRLALNGMDDVTQVNSFGPDGQTASTPEQLIAGLIATGHSVIVNDTRYFANFGHLHYNGRDVIMPFFVNTQFIVPGTRRPLLVPVAHAEYEWHIRGPKLNADVAYYFGIDGKSEFRTVDQLDQAWVMKRNAHEYRGADAVEVTRLAGAITRAYMRLHAAHPAIPFGGYYAFGVCQDVIAAIELKMTGQATLFPNTADEGFFTDPRDAEVNDLIRRLPKDRDGRPPDVARIFASLPVGDTDAEMATILIPGLSADLIAVHHAWRDGTLKRVRPAWQRWALAAVAAFAIAAAFTLAMRRRKLTPDAV